MLLHPLKTILEVTLLLIIILVGLQEQNIERGCVLEMLRGVLGTIWDFMSCDGSLK